jgi:CAAX protease family protein
VAVLCSGIFLDLVFLDTGCGIGNKRSSALGIALEVLGLLGPMLGGIGFTYFTQDNESWREYWSRIVDPKRIPAKWYLVIFLFVPVLMAIAVLLDVVLGGGAVLAQIGKTPFLSAPLTIIPFAVHLFIYGPFPEELGWRGYVLDRLQARWNALVSSLILGATWPLWHLPLFYIKDTYPHYSQGAWSLLAVHGGSHSYGCHIHMDFQQHSPQHACGNHFSFHEQFYC